MEIKINLFLYLANRWQIVVDKRRFGRKVW